MNKILTDGSSKEKASVPSFLAKLPKWCPGMMGDTALIIKGNMFFYRKEKRIYTKVVYTGELGTVLRPKHILMLPQECLYLNQKVTLHGHNVVFAIIVLCFEGLI